MSKKAKRLAGFFHEQKFFKKIICHYLIVRSTA